MRADFTAPELALLQATAFQLHLRAYIANTDGAWKNLADLDGISHLYDVAVDLDIDNKIETCGIHLKRDTGATRSLSPLRTDSTLNRDAATDFAPLLDAGRDVYAQVAVTAPGGTPGPSDWHTVFVGTVDRVAFAGPMVVLDCRDEAALLADRYNVAAYTLNYVDAPVPLETAIQEVLDRADTAADATFAPTLYAPTSPDYLVNHFRGEIEPILDQVLRLAQLTGWDARQLWDTPTGAFRFTLYDPQRSKTVPDVTFAPNQYIDVQELAVDRTNVRNQILCSFGYATDASRLVPRGVLDTESISRYGRRTLHFIEATESPINTEAEADAMIAYALSDLKEPDAELQVEMLPRPELELHDLCRFEANGVHFDTDTDLAITKIRTRFGGDKPRTILGLRGTPAAYYRGWIRRARVPVTPVSDTQADVDDFISDIRVTRISATQAQITATLAASVDTVFAYDEVLTATASFPEPDEEPTFVENADNTFTLTVELPGHGQRTYVQLEPRDADYQVLGGVRRITIDPLGEVVAYTTSAEEPSAGSGRITIALTDSGGFVDTTTKVRFRETRLGVTTVHAATTAPASTTTTGTYTYDVTLDAKHPVLVESEWVDTDGSAHPIGSWTFDRDKNANVVNVAAAAEGNTGRVKATFDTDTAIGADCAGYSLDGADWTTFAVDADRAGVATIPLTNEPQTIYVRGKNSAGAWGPSVLAELPPGEVAWTSSAEEPSATTGRVTIVLDDSAGHVDPTQRIRFRVLQNGAVTDGAATTAPGSGTSGTYTKDIVLDAKHPILLEAYATLTDATTVSLGSWTFDRDKNANVVNVAVAPHGDTARVKATFDTDTAVGVDNAGYSLNGGTDWTTFDVASDRTGVVELALTSSQQTVHVRGKNGAGTWGPAVAVELPLYAPELELDVTHGTNQTTIAYTAVGPVELSIDGGPWSAAPASPFVVSWAAAPQEYRFRVNVGGLWAPGYAAIPAIPGTQLVAIEQPVISIDSTNEEFDISWAHSGLPSGYYFRVVWQDDDANVGYRNSSATSTTGALSLTSGGDHGYATIDPGFTWEISCYVEARTAGGAIAGTSPVATERFSHT